MKISIPLKGDTHEQLRARMALVKLHLNGDLPHEMEIKAFAEMANLPTVAQHWEDLLGFPVPVSMDEWFRLLGRGKGDITPAMFVEGKIRPRMVLEWFATKWKQDQITVKRASEMSGRDEGDIRRKCKDKSFTGFQRNRKDNVWEIDEQSFANWLKENPPKQRKAGDDRDEDEDPGDLWTCGKCRTYKTKSIIRPDRCPTCGRTSFIK